MAVANEALVVRIGPRDVVQALANAFAEMAKDDPELLREIIRGTRQILAAFDKRLQKAKSATQVQ